MKYNIKKVKLSQKKLDHETTEPWLDDQRKKRGHENIEDEGNFDRVLDDERKNDEETELTEKQFKKNKKHKKASEEKTLEARMDDDRTVLPGNWRDDRTHKTNTLPINELAEEKQRARMKAEGQGDGLIEGHYQSYKKETIGLSDENFATLKEAVDQMDHLWMASSFNRLTTSEKKKVKELQAKRNKLLGKMSK